MPPLQHDASLGQRHDLVEIVVPVGATEAEEPARQVSEDLSVGGRPGRSAMSRTTR